MSSGRIRADPKGPLGIANDPFGDQDCNAWSDWIPPGWSAATWHDFDVATDDERLEIVDRVRALWERQGREITVRAQGNPRPLKLHIDESSCNYITFPVSNVVPVTPDGSILVSIGCLPVD